MGPRLKKHHSRNTILCMRTPFLPLFLLCVICGLANCSQEVNQSENEMLKIAENDDEMRSNGKVFTSGLNVEHRNKVRSKAIQKRHTSAGDKVPCQPLPRELLRKILGPAYNPRYMSFDRPDTERTPSGGTTDTASGKGNQKDQAWRHDNNRRKIEAFHVHEGYTRILYEEPVLLEDYLGTRQLDVSLLPSSLITHKQTDQPDQSLPIATPPLTKRRTWTRQSKSSSKKSTTAAAAAATASAKDVKSKGQHNYFKMDEFEQVEPAPQEPVAEKNNKEKNKGPDKFLRLIRGKRNVKNGFPWACDSRIEWLDLGPNHFPRFLRTVVCTSDKCWFGHFQCRPKAFTVKILRRRKDSCILPSGGSSTAILNYGEEEMSDEVEDTNSHVPPEFREQWIFEERAVTFCCECAA